MTNYDRCVGYGLETNLQRFNRYTAYGYDCEGTDLVPSNDDTGIMRCWIIDDNGKRIPHTTIYKVWTDPRYEEVDFETLKEARAYYKKETGRG